MTDRPEAGQLDYVPVSFSLCLGFGESQTDHGCDEYPADNHPEAQAGRLQDYERDLAPVDSFQLVVTLGIYLAVVVKDYYEDIGQHQRSQNRRRSDLVDNDKDVSLPVVSVPPLNGLAHVVLNAVVAHVVQDGAEEVLVEEVAEADEVEGEYLGVEEADMQRVSGPTLSKVVHLHEG